MEYLGTDNLAAVLPVVANAIGGRVCGEDIANPGWRAGAGGRDRAFDPHFDGAVAGRAGTSRVLCWH